MFGFWLIIGTMLLGDAVFAVWAILKLKKFGPRARWWWIAFALFAAAQMTYLLWFIGFPMPARRAHAWLPMPVLAIIYTWHLLVMPIVLIGVLGESLVRLVMKFLYRPATKRTNFSTQLPAVASAAAPSRREFLGTLATVGAAPLFTGIAVGQGLMHLRDFRIKEMDVVIPGMPRALDGVRIVHLTDLHVGRWTRNGFLPAVAEATNRLKADLVLFTGDLIDLALADLPAGIDFINRLDPRHGLFLVEGNHDLIESRPEFESRVVAANLPVLFDNTQTVSINGQPVQLLGLRWSRGEQGIVQSMARLTPMIQRNAFPILLAHHPHAFDVAAAARIPLTLAGHTHGGQLMLNERLGGGPMLFRYWSGLYRKNDAQLVVSNGVGNWFPVRVNAPAEIVHITLRS